MDGWIDRCIELLGSEFHALGPVYIIDCFPIDMLPLTD